MANATEIKKVKCLGGVRRNIVLPLESLCGEGDFSLDRFSSGLVWPVKKGAPPLVEVSAWEYKGSMRQFHPPVPIHAIDDQHGWAGAVWHRSDNQGLSKRVEWIVWLSLRAWGVKNVLDPQRFSAREPGRSGKFVGWRPAEFEIRVDKGFAAARSSVHSADTRGFASRRGPRVRDPLSAAILR